MNSCKYYYDPDTIELLIVKVEPAHGLTHYEIKCKKMVKKYIFWGDLVESFDSVYVGYDHKYLIEVAKFKTESDAELTARSLRFDNASVVKTIKVANHDS
jgi:hypothetical protein